MLFDLVLTYHTDKGENVVDVVFLCEYDAGEAFPKSPNEVENVYWLTVAEMQQNPKAPDYLIDSIKKAELLINRD